MLNDFISFSLYPTTLSVEARQALVDYDESLPESDAKELKLDTIKHCSRCVAFANDHIIVELEDMAVAMSYVEQHDKKLKFIPE